MRSKIWHKLWKRLHRSERGSTSIIMAFSVIGLIGMGALGIDIAGAVRTQNTLQNVLDSTALQVARRSVSDRTLSASQLRQFGEDTVRAQVGQGVTFQRFDINVNGVSVDIEATNVYETHFAVILRQEWRELDIVSTASAVFDLGDIDFFMLLDNSPSMGLGAIVCAGAGCLLNPVNLPAIGPVPPEQIAFNIFKEQAFSCDWMLSKMPLID